MSILSRIKIWWKASMLDYPYWRVIYQDGRRTYLLKYGEAKGLSEVFNAKLKIDYEAAKALPY